MRNTLIAAMLGVLALTGCSSTGPAASSPSSDVGATTSQSAPAPDYLTAQKADYLAALDAIDPGLVVNEERALRRGQRVCDRILRGSDGGTMSLEEYTVAELSGGNATINEAQAKQVIKAVKVWCKP
ncbi:DUF732 domain-containing protein [Nonomuraea spiralis]|uniref:DUF732 domain-containing protein n=1 Tax=Nonomuraea spiralis TaxID=46182 RepID=A0ABV5IYD7_9ACTN|nr:DUF732 domain-containing protein [Nonomuraea spiralis]GGS88455.1 hypothetical protein GCM10010176_035280 [Nonomuraea spiralis]